MNPITNLHQGQNKVIVSMGYDNTTTNITLASGHGAILPDPSITSYSLIWWNVSDYLSPTDDPSVEVVKCIAKFGDTLVIMRSQQQTLASPKNIPGKLYNMALLPDTLHDSNLDTNLNTLSYYNIPQTHGISIHTGIIGDHSTNLSSVGTNTHAQIDTAITTSIGHIAASGTSVHSLGTMSTQAANNVSITGGSITGIIDLTVSGNVGIGTASPAAKLDVTGGDIQLSSGQTKLVFDSPYRYIQGYRADGDYLTIAQNNYASGIQFGFTSGTFGPTLTILSPGGGLNIVGNVGIGTTTPSALLHLKGSTDGAMIIERPSGTLYHNFLDFINGAGVQWRIGQVPSPNNDFVIYRNGDAGNQLYLQAGGNIGIGTTSPANKLDVAGNGRFISDPPQLYLTYSGDSYPVELRKHGHTFAIAYPMGWTGNLLSAELPYWSGVKFVVANDGSIQCAGNINLGTIATGGGISSPTVHIEGISGNSYFNVGNVGIGITDPTAKLHVGGTSGVDGIKFPDGTLQTTAAVGQPITTYYASNAIRVAHDVENLTISGTYVVNKTITLKQRFVGSMTIVYNHRTVNFAGTNMSKVLVNGSLVGSEHTQGDNANNVYSVTVSNVDYAVNTTIEVWAKSTGSYPYTYISNFRLLYADAVNS